MQYIKDVEKPINQFKARKSWTERKCQFT